MNQTQSANDGFHSAQALQKKLKLRNRLHGLTQQSNQSALPPAGRQLRTISYHSQRRSSKGS